MIGRRDSTNKFRATSNVVLCRSFCSPPLFLCRPMQQLAKFRLKRLADDGEVTRTRSQILKFKLEKKFFSFQREQQVVYK